MRGTLRIHFTDADLARLRLAERPDPLWEIALASQKLGATTGGLAFDHWRATVGEGRAPERRRSSAGVVRALVPRHGSFPDFITPAEGSFRGGWSRAVKKSRDHWMRFDEETNTWVSSIEERVPPTYRRVPLRGDVQHEIFKNAPRNGKNEPVYAGRPASALTGIDLLA